MIRLLPILFLVLGLAIATRELPELYNLVDDPSNDASVLTWQAQTPLRARHDAKSKEAIPPAGSVTFARGENHSRTSLLSAKTGQDILRLVRSRRT